MHHGNHDVENGPHAIPHLLHVRDIQLVVEGDGMKRSVVLRLFPTASQRDSDIDVELFLNQIQGEAASAGNTERFRGRLLRMAQKGKPKSFRQSEQLSGFIAPVHFFHTMPPCLSII